MNHLKKYIDYKGISVLAFEKSIGTRSTIDKAIKANTNLRSDIITRIIEKYTDINVNWILTGEGEMIVDPTEDFKYVALEEQVKSLQNANEKLELKVENLKLKIEVSKLKTAK